MAEEADAAAKTDSGIGWGEIIRQVGAGITRAAGAYTNYAGAATALETAGLQARTNALLSSIDQALMAGRNQAYMAGIEQALSQIEQVYGDTTEAQRAISALREQLGTAAAATAASDALMARGAGARMERQIDTRRGMREGSVAEEQQLGRRIVEGARQAGVVGSRRAAERGYTRSLDEQRARRVRGVRGMEPDTAGSLMPYQQALRSIGVAGAAQTERLMGLQPLLHAISGTIAEGTAYGTGLHRDYEAAKLAEEERREYQGEYFGYQPPEPAEDAPEVGGEDDDASGPYSLDRYLSAVPWLR